MLLRKCTECGEGKSFKEFYTHPSGLQKRCKTCAKARATANRNANLDRIRAYDRERGNRQSPGYLKQYRKDNPEKYLAHNALNNAVRDGKILKPLVCSRCACTCVVHGHHEDYSKPLEVEWLCAACHHGG
jgi:hypothetical protein